MSQNLRVKMVNYCRQHPEDANIEWLRSLVGNTSPEALKEITILGVSAGLTKDSLQCANLARFLKNVGTAVPAEDRAANLVSQTIARQAAGDSLGVMVDAAKKLLNVPGGGAHKKDLSAVVYGRLLLASVWEGAGNEGVARGGAGYESSKEFMRIFATAPTLKKAMSGDINVRRKYFTDLI